MTTDNNVQSETNKENMEMVRSLGCDFSDINNLTFFEDNIESLTSLVRHNAKKSINLTAHDA